MYGAMSLANHVELMRETNQMIYRSAAEAEAKAASGEESDLVVRGGSIVDGTGSERFDSDVGVRDGKIAAVGPGLGKGAREIDARGRLVPPLCDARDMGRVIRGCRKGKGSIFTSHTHTRKGAAKHRQQVRGGRTRRGRAVSDRHGARGLVDGRR